MGSLPLTPGEKGLRLFVVYHQKLHAAYYAQLSAENLARLTFYKVNQAIAFEVGMDRGPLRIVREYDLPDHDPFYQDKAYNEGSCIIHAWRNGLFEGASHAGILQYDMPVTDDHFRYWDNLRTQGVPIIADARYGPVSPATLAMDYVREPPFYGFPMGFVVDHFCRHFGVERQVFLARLGERFAEGQQLALLNSFIIETALFDELAEWMLAIGKAFYEYTQARPDQANHHGHMGGIVERCLGLFLLFHASRERPLVSLGVNHIPNPESHRTRFGQL